jgi:hypothetical protein
MNKTEIEEIAALFKTPKEWAAFVELANKKDEVENYFLKEIDSDIKRWFSENALPEWSLEKWGKEKAKFKFCVGDHDVNSLAIGIGWTFEVHLVLGRPDLYNSGQIDELLKDKYINILEFFEESERDFDERFKAAQRGKYYFGSEHDGFFNDHRDELKWFAKNETEKLKEQLFAKLKYFLCNEEITQMMLDINNETKK